MQRKAFFSSRSEKKTFSLLVDTVVKKKTNRMCFSVVCTLIDINTRHRSCENVVDSRGAVQVNSPRISSSVKCIFSPRESRLMATLSTEELGAMSKNTRRGITLRRNSQSCEAHFAHVDTLGRFTHIFTFNVKIYTMPVAILSAIPRIMKDESSYI